MKWNRICLQLLGMILLVSCAQVELNEKTATPSYAGVKMSFDWGNYSKPDSVVVLMNRILNSYHYVQTLSVSDLEATNMASITSRAETEDDTVLPEDGEWKDGKFHIKGGEYLMLAINQLKEGVELTNLDSFATDKSISISEMKVSVQTTKLTDIPELTGSSEDDYIKWMDFNPNYPYIRTIAPVYVAIARNIKVETGNEIPVTFVPQMLTQNIRIPFKVQIEEGVEITKVVAEISGIVKETDVTTGMIDSTTTCRIIFKPEIKQQDGNILSYEGKVDVLGLFPSRTPSLITGAGILQLAVYTQAEGKNKIFHTAKNLYHEIRDAELMTYEGNKKYRLAKESATLNTDYMFKISVKQIVSDNEDGIDIWQESDSVIEGDI